MGRSNYHEPDVASSSATIKAQGCSCRAESVHWNIFELDIDNLTSSSQSYQMIYTFLYWNEKESSQFLAFNRFFLKIHRLLYSEPKLFEVQLPQPRPPYYRVLWQRQPSGPCEVQPIYRCWKNGHWQGWYRKLVSWFGFLKPVKSLSQIWDEFSSGPGCSITWLVESDMPIFTNTTKKKFNPSVIFDLLLVCVTLSDQIFCISVKNVDLRRWNIN